MGNVIEFKKDDDQLTEVVEIATTQLTEHSRQAEYSPPMDKKKWAEFVASVKEEGIHQPVIVSRGFKVIGNTYHFRAAKELGISNVKAVFMDVADNGVPSFITNNILQVPELKPGQRAAIVIRLFYEEERQKAKERQGVRTDLNGNIPENFQEGSLGKETAEILADKAGMTSRNIYFLLAVYRNRLDLFELVFDGTYTINKAYTQMKADEEPEQVEEITPEESLKKTIEKMIENDSTQPQIDESEHELSPRNRAVRLRKDSLSMSAKILSEAEIINSTEDSVKDSARSQLLSLASSCIITLGQTAEKQGEQDLLYMALEVIKKIEEELNND